MKTTPDKIVRVADKHIELYESRILRSVNDRHAKRIDREECKRYLSLWQYIRMKCGQNLSKEELNEVKDAYYSGEYDDIFHEADQ